MARVNLTGRSRIREKDVKARLHISPEGCRAYLYLTADLAEYEFPDTVEVIAEVYVRSRMIRVPVHYDGEMAALNGVELENLPSPDSVLLRLKVIERNGETAPILRGLARAIRPDVGDDSGETGTRSLLPVESEDLGGELWRLYVDERHGPTLQIDESLNVWEVARDPVFMATAYPALLRQVLIQIVILDEVTTPDGAGADDWRTDWLAFAVDVNPEAANGKMPSLTEGKEEAWEWIDRTASAMAVRLGAAKLYSQGVGNA